MSMREGGIVVELAGLDAIVWRNKHRGYMLEAKSR